MIEAKGLCMRYGEFSALEDASFSARTGEVVGLLGPNGAGKTTTMRILTTYLVPTSGTAEVAGIDVVKDPVGARRRTGYLPEQLPLYTAMEVQECLRFVGRARGLSGAALTSRLSWVVEACGLAAYYHSPVMTLSKGFRQRTALAQALIHDPEVVILDEPTTGLDPHQIVGIRTLIRDLARTKTVILSTHILQEASALSDRLVLVSEGRIAGAGTSDEIIRQARLAARVTVAFDGAPADAAAKLASAADGGRVAAEGGKFTIDEKDPGLAARIGRLAQAERWALVELSRAAPTLEDAFLALTRKSGGTLAGAASQPLTASPKEAA
ncbi:MAG: putative multidrug ABC transporter ATP-binding protein YbhF [Planctomycetes bacterium]|nr:putative multidrug ABC transporter ATP-binding protein YbhF [Planctomycetota bacterium]